MAFRHWREGLYVVACWFKQAPSGIVEPSKQISRIFLTVGYQSYSPLILD